MKFVFKLNFTFDGHDVNEEQFEKINIESEVIKILLQSCKKLAQTIGWGSTLWMTRSKIKSLLRKKLSELKFDFLINNYIYMYLMARHCRKSPFQS